MPWNSIQEDILKKWSSMSKTYSMMHTISAEYYNNVDKRLGIPVVLLGAIAASSIFATNANNSGVTWPYINGALVLGMTFLSGISKFLGTSERQVKHTTASYKYTKICMNIDTLLSFQRQDREESPRLFINQIKLEILEIRENSPEIPIWIISDYIRKLDKSLVSTRTKVNRSNSAERKENTPPIDPYVEMIKLNELNVGRKIETPLTNTTTIKKPNEPTVQHDEFKDFEDRASVQMIDIANALKKIESDSEEE